MAQFITRTAIISSQTFSVHFPVFPPDTTGYWSSGYLQPGILAILSSGASMTYNIEVTGDDPTVAGWKNSTANWIPFTNMSGLTASATGTLGAMVTAIRANVTAYTSGTLTFQFIQAQ